MNEKLRGFWSWLITSRHERWLESEVERLRAECAEARRQNWALVNSLVTTAGAPLPQEVLRSAATAAPGLSGKETTDSTGAANADSARRARRGRASWHQMARALEIESGREFHRGVAHVARER